MNSKEALEEYKKIYVDKTLKFEFQPTQEWYLDIIKQDLDRLEKLEKIENELGCHLDVAFKATQNGIYFKENNEIHFSSWIIRVGKSFVEVKPCYAVKETTLASCYYKSDTEELKYVKDAHYWDWKTCRNWKIKDYGKTWALTREELIND